MDQDKVGSDNGKIWKEGESLHFLPGRLPAASAVSLRDDGARSLAVIYFRGVPLESPSSLLLPPVCV